MSSAPSIPSEPPVVVPLPANEVPAFVESPGVLSGRVVDEDGVASFILGDLANLRFEAFDHGDYIEVWQNVDLTNVQQVKTEGEIPGVESSTLWKLQILINSTVYAEKNLSERISSTTISLMAPVKLVTGVARVAVRLIYE